MSLRNMGRTDLRVSEVGFGAWAIGGGFNIAGNPIGYGTVDEQTSLAALHRAFELGINFVDTADAYGAGVSERLVGQALKHSPRRVYVATKVGNVRRDPDPGVQDFSRKYVLEACDQSLIRLGITRIDLYQLHNPPLSVIENNEIWDTLRELKDRSKIAHYGISIGAPREGVIAIEKGGVDAIQVVYNLLEREPEIELFPLAEKRSVGIIARVPLASGLLSGKYAPGHRFANDDHRSRTFGAGKLETQLARVEKLKFLAQNTGRTLAQAALKFCLANPAVSIVIPGIKTAEQAHENISAANVPDLTQDELARIAAV
jgi:aryl-alcohol dehydrogenase-like predicted oxidoreductase